MLFNYLRTAWRSFRKNRFFTLINLAGLTTGLSCCLLIGLYIQQELSYDNFEQKGDRIVRMIMEYSFGQAVNKGNYTSTKVAPAFQRAFPEIESAVRMTQSSRIVKAGDKVFDEQRFLFADSSFFNVFSFSLPEGDRQTALNGPEKLVLTQSAAEKYFGNSSPIGKTMFIGSNATPFQVTGVIQDCPANSQIKFDLLASFSSLHANQEETYWNANYTTYLLLKSPSAIHTLQEKIGPFMKKEMADAGQGTYINFELEPLRWIHLHSAYEGFEPNNSITYIYIIAAIALLILAIACFTYVNLGTAISVERAREVGVRKVLGAERGQVFWQYICESLFLCFIAWLISLVVVALSLPYFNTLAGKNISLQGLFSPESLLYSLLLLLCMGLVAGSYPALVLAGFQPIRVLKGAFRYSPSGIWVRKSLIVFQFMISAFLIISTLIIQSQLDYIQHKKLGYDRDHILVLPADSKMQAQMQAMKTEMLQNKDIIAASVAVNDPTHILGGYSMSRPEMPQGQVISVRANPIDKDYIKTTGIEILTGSDLTAQDVADVTEAKNEKDVQYHFILNESAVREMGWTPESAIGKKMFLGEQRPGTVKAVIKDFHFESLHNPIKPLVLFSEGRGSVLLVKLSGQHLPQTIAYLQTVWKKMVPYRPFEYHFLDENYQKMYASETRLGAILHLFTAIAILLACLGLFGLASFSAKQRVKEIGIRKVLGASTLQLVNILTREFIGLAAIAYLLALPLAWWGLYDWLQDFSYRTRIHWWIFPLAAGVTLFLALFTVSIRVWKAALANPVKSLRTE